MGVASSLIKGEALFLHLQQSSIESKWPSYLNNLLRLDLVDTGSYRLTLASMFLHCNWVQ